MKSSVPKVAAKSLNIFEFQVLLKLQALKKLSFFLDFLSWCSEGRSRNPIRSKMVLWGGS